MCNCGRIYFYEQQCRGIILGEVTGGQAAGTRDEGETMSWLEKLIETLRAGRESVDDALVVAGLSSAGVPELAKQHIQEIAPDTAESAGRTLERYRMTS
jgi:hypothetical protein